MKLSLAEMYSTPKLLSNGMTYREYTVNLSHKMGVFTRIFLTRKIYMDSM